MVVTASCSCSVGEEEEEEEDEGGVERRRGLRGFWVVVRRANGIDEDPCLNDLAKEEEEGMAVFVCVCVERKVSTVGEV